MNTRHWPVNLKATPRWDRYPEYRPPADLCRGDQTSDGYDFGWSTITRSQPCEEHPGCHILVYYGERATHRPAGRTILSRLPWTQQTYLGVQETTVEIRR